MTHRTPASTDAYSFPYALSDDTHRKLEQLQGLLQLLASLTGEVARVKPKDSPEMGNRDLHHALWGLNDLIDDVMDTIIVWK